MSLSYQHSYHAGNLADVHKHLWLVATLQYLQQKEKPLFWLDAHAGGGHYDLQSAEARKTQEAAGGIARLWQLTAITHPLWQSYRAVIAAFNTPDQPLRYYPGSALIIAHLLRSTDRALCCELHPRESQRLAATLKPYRRVQVMAADMAKTWPAALPPHERRGGMLIDPSYELKSDYHTIPAEALAAIKKWPTGCFLIWYPLLSARRHEALTARLRAAVPNLVIDEWRFAPAPTNERPGLLGSGIAAVNPPYSVPEQLAELKGLLASLIEGG